MNLKFWGGLIFVLLLSGCKDLLNKPLEGEAVDRTRYALAGNWESAAKGIHLSLSKTNQEDWYKFAITEPNRAIEGRLKIAYFKRKLALSVDAVSLRINGEPLIREDRQGYFLVGMYYDEDELRIVPADMEKFERKYAECFFAAPIDLASFCPRNNPVCKDTFASGNVLLSRNRRQFNQDFIKHFRTIFPRRKSVIFTPSNL